MKNYKCVVRRRMNSVRKLKSIQINTQDENNYMENKNISFSLYTILETEFVADIMSCYSKFSTKLILLDLFRERINISP